MRMPALIWRRLFEQTVSFAFCFAELKTGNSNAARMAMMAMTTSSSVNVNARFESMSVGQCRLPFVPVPWWQSSRCEDWLVAARPAPPEF
jgi:hypothetical protein